MNDIFENVGLVNTPVSVNYDKNSDLWKCSECDFKDKDPLVSLLRSLKSDETLIQMIEAGIRVTEVRSACFRALPEYCNPEREIDPRSADLAFPHR